jgi:glutathione S-transferase
MRLFGTIPSPYVRLCRLVAERRGLERDVEFVVSNPLEEEHRRFNPLRKVPAFEAGDGTLLLASAVIVRYLDGLGAAPSLFDVETKPRHQVEGVLALITGILDLGVAHVMEGRRPEKEQSPSWQKRRLDGIAKALDLLAEEEKGLPEEAGILDLALATALDWLSFRLPQVDWQRHEGLSRRALRLLATAPFEATDPRSA